MRKVIVRRSYNIKHHSISWIVIIPPWNMLNNDIYTAEEFLDWSEAIDFAQNLMIQRRKLEQGV